MGKVTAFFSVASMMDPSGISQLVALISAGVDLVRTVKEGVDNEEEIKNLINSLQSAYNALADKRRKPGPALRKKINEAKEALKNERWNSALSLLEEASGLVGDLTTAN